MPRPAITWVTTDWHLGHHSLYRKGLRPLLFDETILDAHKFVIQPQDTLINLGDLLWAAEPWPTVLRDWIAQVPCRHVLVLGNHDKKTRGWYASLGYDMVCDGLILKDVLLTHKPTPPPPGMVNVHGHWHNNDFDHCMRYETLPYDPARQFRLAIEWTGYGPVDLFEWTKKQRKEAEVAN